METNGGQGCTMLDKDSERDAARQWGKEEPMQSSCANSQVGAPCTQ